MRGILVGEENSKFFHAMASERMRRNSISSLVALDGTICTDHTRMAGLLWNSFKGRMGVSHELNMLFDLASLIQPVLGLEDLSLPFSKEEIDAVLKELPVDRAPRPDGFNGVFLKRCWPIIEKDFLDLISQFASGKLKLECIDGSLITLIPKMLAPEGPNDFRPISLSNTCLKYLTSF